jgi:hypothetical protein
VDGSQVAGIGDVLGDAGSLPEIEYGGKVWKVGKATQRAGDCLVQLTIRAAMREIQALKGIIDPADYREMFDDFTVAVQKGAYRTWGDRWSAMSSGMDGTVRFLLSLLRERHPDATEAEALALMVNCGDEVKVAFAQVLPPFLFLLLDSHPAVLAASTELRAKVKADVFPQIMAAFRPLIEPSPTNVSNSSTP